MAATPKFNPRKMMEKAIEEMKKSIAEPRSDGKKSPMVGAVLIKPDGSVETAHRGELREGDHAEFALLERKNRANNLAGSTLFATLEPCAPGSRRHPKLGCAERIVNARIKEVWVGLEDPDPTVDRKGIKFLQDSGITVHMFERDLQQQIRDLNKEFFAQALERKAAAEAEEKKEVTLSVFEKSAASTDWTDFSTEVLERYRTVANISDAVSSSEFQRRFVQQGLLRAEGQALVPAGFGILLFGKSPRTLMPQAGMLGTIHYPDGTEEVYNFEGPMVLIPEQVIQWLKDKLPNPINRSGAQREALLGKFYELVREGVVNALVHRDYDIGGAKCQLVVTPDMVTIKSPGGPIEPITLKQLQTFNAPMLSRNPVLHYVFGQMELAEERGLGLKSMKARATELGLPLPRYSWEDPYLVLTLFRSPAAAAHVLKSGARALLTNDEKASWEFIAGRQTITSPELMKQMGYDERKAQRVLKELQGTGLLRRVGRGRATHYEVVS